MKRQMLVAIFGLVVAVSAPTALSAQEPQSWLHVQINAAGDDAGNVAVNLPLRAVGAVMAMAPDGILSSDGRLLVAEEHGVSVRDIREAWQGVKDAGDAEFFTFQEDDRTVRVARAGDQIEVRLDGDDDETVRVDLPLALVDALLSGDGDTLNIAAALDQLSTLRGDIVRVTEDERQIRVWVDQQSAQ